MSIEKRLTELESGLGEVKTMQSEFEKNNERLQMLLERMEWQLCYYENRKKETEINQAELLRAFGLMNQSKQSEHEPIEDSLNNSAIKSSI